MDDKSNATNPALELWALSYVGGTWQSRSSWLNMRINDLGRMVDGVKQASMRVLDDKTSVDELDVQIKYLVDRLQHIRDHAAAVAELRAQQKPTASK